MKRLGGGDLFKGFDVMNSKSYFEARKEVSHPVSCIDCHNPADMTLRVTRPAFMEGIAAYKASLGIKNYDVNKMATRQEMRAFVCGQCHVEYYFKGPEKRLTFPWSNGLKGDEILAYYNQAGFKDWVHKETGAEVLKAQHPEFEMWNQGTHAAAGVTCVDCHMPYKKQGAMKITDHHIQSPLLNINRSCQNCHHVPEAELLKRAEIIQTRHVTMRDTAMNALMSLISDISAAQAKMPDSNKIKQARTFQRKAQFLLDFVEAENSTGFHAPQEAARLLTLSIDYTRQGQLALHGE
jgi:nitrite reductase (cytochrome c-552)